MESQPDTGPEAAPNPDRPHSGHCSSAGEPRWSVWLRWLILAVGLWMAGVWAWQRSGTPWWVGALAVAGLGVAALGAGFALGGLWDALGRERQRRLIWGLGWLQLLVVVPTAGGLISIAYIFLPLTLLILALALFERDNRRRAEAEVGPPPAAPVRPWIDADDLLASINRLKDLTDLTENHQGIFDWAKAREISSVALFQIGDIVAEAWFEDIAGIDRERLTDREWAAVCASYAFAISIGVEAERTRRDSAELPGLSG